LPLHLSGEVVPPNPDEFECADEFLFGQRGNSPVELAMHGDWDWDLPGRDRATQ